MPFMKGRAAMRRTMRYLEARRVFLKEEIEVMTINYNNGQAASKGAYDFVFWHVPQVQYCNPNVQIVTFKNMTPSPCIQFFFNNGEKMVMDLDSTSRHDILAQIQKSVCRSRHEVQEDIDAKLAKYNKAAFGYSAPRWCICEVPGHVPCPGWVPLPKHMRGKYNQFGKVKVEVDEQKV